MSETICSILNEQFYIVYKINSNGKVVLKYTAYVYNDQEHIHGYVHEHMNGVVYRDWFWKSEFLS